MLPLLRSQGIIVKRFAAILLAVVVCSVVAFGQRTKPITTGQWGGAGISMEVSSRGATLQFDCANGEISKQLRMSRKGDFGAVGTFTRSGPGPIRVDRPPLQSSATYKGKISGKSMTLRITDATSHQDLGTFTLTRGAGGRIHRCY